MQLKFTVNHNTFTVPCLKVVLTCYPVNSNTLHSANAISDNVFSPGLVSLGPAYSAQAHINPVDSIIIWKKKNIVILNA